MQEATLWPHNAQRTDTLLAIATDGGCKHTPYGLRAGWGLSTSEDTHLRGAVHGRYQTAERAEVTAALMALAWSPGPVHLLTDSRYVHDRLRIILRGGHFQSLRRGDLWRRITDWSHKLRHLT